ncbi:hypothetical protein BGZ73_008097, partial [Actinomortierella ambigua]
MSTQPPLDDQDDDNVSPLEHQSTKTSHPASIEAMAPEIPPEATPPPLHSSSFRPGPYSSPFSTASPSATATGTAAPAPGTIGMDHHPQHHPHLHQRHRTDTHNNPYRAPCVTNSNAFIPPKVPGYDFKSGSQAGYVGLMLGKRISDGQEVTGKLHLSKVLLQHEYRIQTRLQIVDNQYDYRAVKEMDNHVQSACSTSTSTPTQGSSADTPSPATVSQTSSTPQDQRTSTSNDDTQDSCGPSKKRASDSPPRATSHASCGSRTPRLHKYEPGLIEGEKFFNRIVEGFVDLDQEDVSVLLMRQLGYNLLSHQHTRFRGLDDSPEFAVNPPCSTASPLPDIYSFLIFCLKAAGLLEALQRHNLAHLAICPISLHWMAGPEGVPDLLRPTTTPSNDSPASQPSSIWQQPSDGWDRGSIQTNKCVYALSREQAAFDNRSFGPQWKRVQTMNSQSIPITFNPREGITENRRPSTPPPRYVPRAVVDVEEHIRQLNATKLRLFDFTHSKILSHERARAPNNIIEWQVPGFMEYHLQFLAPEQTGRAETWMDHRTDIYSMGVTLFTLLTMQFPNRGTDSVQVLQGVLSRELPPLSDFRPDMPPIIDSILRKMTQKQPINRYQTAFGFKQDILRCLNMLTRTGK